MTTYPDAPNHFESHGRIDLYNKMIKEMNREMFYGETYEVDKLIIRPIKTGEAGLVVIDGKRYNSIQAFWRNINGHHFQDHVLDALLADLRIFLNADFKIGTRTMEETQLIGVKITEKPLPKKNKPPAPTRPVPKPFIRSNYSEAAQRQGQPLLPPPEHGSMRSETRRGM